MSTAEQWGADLADFYRQRGNGGRVGVGSRPVLLVVDMQVAFNDPKYRVGSDQTGAVVEIRRLIQAARGTGTPVVFVKTVYGSSGRDAGLFGKKVPAILDLRSDDEGSQIDPRLEPRPDECVITKKSSSAFFQTNLSSLLVADARDTIVLTGCSTSGCIRATAVDGVSHGYRMIVPREAVSDRAEAPHRASLFDIDMKYGDVISVADAIRYLDAQPAVRRPSGHREAM